MPQEPGGDEGAPPGIGSGGWTTFGPYEHRGYFYQIHHSIAGTDLFGNPTAEQWIGEVFDAPPATGNLLKAFSGTNRQDVIDQCIAWINAIISGYTPPEGEDLDVVQNGLDDMNVDEIALCIPVNFRLDETDFVQTSKKADKRFSTNLFTKSDEISITLPPDWVGQFKISVVAKDNSLPAAMRRADHAEQFNVTLRGGDSLYIGNGSISIVKNGTERVDPFEFNEMVALYDEVNVTLTVIGLWDCEPAPSNGNGENGDNNEGNGTDNGDSDEDEGGWSQDTLWMILGGLVIFLMVGYFLNTSKEGQ